MLQVKIKIVGVVQGVGFRPFIYRIALKNDLKGFVRNKGDAGVEILLEGKKSNIQNFLETLQANKPPLAEIYDIVTTKISGEITNKKFKIYKSTKDTELSGSVIPPDIAICNNCLSELKEPKNKRSNYFFITCTDCGPRYTLIENLPYDRENTTMNAFQMCSFCQREYTDPSNRRFHAQTIACTDCGPRLWLTTKNGERVESEDFIREAGKLISEGYIVAIKGYGGFHLASSAIRNKPLTKLREVKYRKQKPFAIMAKSLDAIKSFAKVTLQETKLLTSYSRPIVLLNKRNEYPFSDLIAPGLHNIGVMLPYTGLHYMLFDKIVDLAFVMTSANPSNQPIIKNNEDALRRLNKTADYFLFNNRHIAHRCDDSVVRLHSKDLVFIRRSRGYAPAPIRLKEKTEYCVLSLGGEKNNTACILLGDKAFVSQHIGDVENIETRSFLEETIKHLIHLTNSKVNIVASDLHPKFTTTSLAQDLSDQNMWKLVQVQHHYAHVAALMAEYGVNEIVSICCDGYGYGEDGEAWGGEIIFSTSSPLMFKRTAHLEKQPLIGGDLATKYPLRVTAGILNKRMDIKKWLMQRKNFFPYGEKEIQIIYNKLMKKDHLMNTTSCGRVLDAVAAVLGICYERTYEGEPAMKLESLAIKGKDVLKLEPIIDGNVLDTTQILLNLFENKKKISKKDLAHSAHIYLAKGLANMAIINARHNNVKTIGFTGGVACNELFTSTIRKIVEAQGLKFLVHRIIPPGDGGLSLGQAVVASKSLNHN